jgi:hypothetical protein
VISASRNRLLLINLFITVTTMCAGLVVLVPNTFGMNLTSGLEEEPDRFRIVVLACTGALVGSVLLAYRLISAYV